MKRLWWFVAGPARAQISFLPGGWEWVVTAYADGTSISPSTEGHAEHVLFADAGAFMRYRDLVPVATSTWSSLKALFRN